MSTVWNKSIEKYEKRLHELEDSIIFEPDDDRLRETVALIDYYKNEIELEKVKDQRFLDNVRLGISNSQTVTNLGIGIK